MHLLGSQVFTIDIMQVWTILIERKSVIFEEKNLFVWVPVQLLPAAAAAATCCLCCPMLTNIALPLLLLSFEAAVRGPHSCPSLPGVYEKKDVGHVSLKSWHYFYDCSPQWLHVQFSLFLWYVSKREGGHKAQLGAVCVQEESPLGLCWPLHTPQLRSYQATKEAKPLISDIEGSGNFCCRKI